jgi:nicotinamidase-related amidase
MSAIRPNPETDIVVVIDVQPTMMSAIWEAGRVTSGAVFLAQVAAALQIPVLATVQNPKRLGPIAEALTPFVRSPMAKMEFSAWKNAKFRDSLEASGRRQVILAGVETHICVSQTALDLNDAGFDVLMCPDVVSARTQDRHKLGMERLRDAGIGPIHSEAVVYEWMQTADHPRFREVLQLVKARPES